MLDPARRGREVARDVFGARFERSLDAAGIGPNARDRFYEHNFVDLMGGRVPAPRP